MLGVRLAAVVRRALLVVAAVDASVQVRVALRAGAAPPHRSLDAQGGAAAVAGRCHQGSILGSGGRAPTTPRDEPAPTRNGETPDARPRPLRPLPAPRADRRRRDGGGLHGARGGGRGG